MRHHQCPVCGYPLHRIHRRPIDHFLNRFYRVHRYLCSNRECRWKGTLHISKRKSWIKYLTWWVWVLAVLLGVVGALAVLTFYKHAPPSEPPHSLPLHVLGWG